MLVVLLAIELLISVLLFELFTIELLVVVLIGVGLPLIVGLLIIEPLLDKLLNDCPVDNPSVFSEDEDFAVDAALLLELLRALIL